MSSAWIRYGFLLLAVACSSAAPGRSTTPAAGGADSDRNDASELRFSPEELSKLDEGLRDRLAELTANPERIPVAVTFRVRPSRDELHELLLVRSGERYIGRVPARGLKRLVEREDVSHVRLLTDTGYRG